LVMVLILELIVYLTLRLTMSWRPARSHSMKQCLVQPYLWVCRWGWAWWKHLYGGVGGCQLGWSRADPTSCPSWAYDDYFSSWSWSLYFHYLGIGRVASSAYASYT
jgi:hypothetical protein